MKVFDVSEMDIKYSESKDVIEVSKIRYSDFTKKSYIDNSIKISESTNIKFADNIFTNIKITENNEENFIYTFDEKIEYMKFLKNECDINNLLFFYDEKEPWFEIDVDYSNDMFYITFDPVFSKMNELLKFSNKNLVFIPSNKNIIKKFMTYNSLQNIKSRDLKDVKQTFAILFKEVSVSHDTFKGLCRRIKIKYEELYILSYSNLRSLKINNLVL